MIPAVPPLIKVMTVVLAGSIVLSPVPQAEPAQAGIANKITQKIIKEIHEKKKQDENPNYKPKKKLPIIGGYKPGKDLLPKGTTPEKVRSKIWSSIKSDLGFK
ncbi:hypothetical protein [Desulfosporosinus lacus]|uniref:Uncharacterized protein n=1 Tax=Desulfosporosinus lacus DSM 15449 TaxID=1121420 RepID=A0A1M5WEX4_9FIRM|nr:hypothetical protein [Desulfosporosinus lacus]SHH86042.1 hypothetical protein SAMN02746098_01587 [Desulfosporosinus lacus DSM 15449]